MILERTFYNRDVVEVSQDLLGKRLIHLVDGERVGGIIIETEAYDGEQDQACHARKGLTKRNAPMYGEPGHAYIYFTYGMHWLLNCVTGKTGYPAAVLIRTLIPTEGIAMIAENREGIHRKHWCDGPAKLTRALGIDGEQNQADLCNSSGEIWIEDGITIPTSLIHTSPRIGIGYAAEPWRSIPWRFFIRDDSISINNLIQ